MLDKICVKMCAYSSPAGKAFSFLLLQSRLARQQITALFLSCTETINMNKNTKINTFKSSRASSHLKTHGTSLARASVLITYFTHFLLETLDDELCLLLGSLNSSDSTRISIDPKIPIVEGELLEETELEVDLLSGALAS